MRNHGEGMNEVAELLDFVVCGVPIRLITHVAVEYVLLLCFLVHGQILY
jgi:hypothetical protein